MVVSRENIKKKISCWLGNQHTAKYEGLASTQRQAQELISGPSPTANTRLLSFNRTKSRAVTGLLTGCNTLRIHIHIMALIDRPLCRRHGTEETSAHIVCKCEVW